jgi:putative transposase
MISDLDQRLRASDQLVTEAQRKAAPAAPPVETRKSDQSRASRIAAEKCGGAVTGRFASVRVNP